MDNKSLQHCGPESNHRKLTEKNNRWKRREKKVKESQARNNQRNLNHYKEDE